MKMLAPIGLSLIVVGGILMLAALAVLNSYAEQRVLLSVASCIEARP